MVIKGSSAELQQVVIKSIMLNPHLFATCSSQIKEQYFEKPEYRLIFNALMKYYGDYMTLPSKEELILLATELYSEDKYGKISDISETITYILDKVSISSEDSAYATVSNFIRRNNIEVAIDDVVSYLQTGEIDLDKVADKLRDGLNISISKRSYDTVSDIENIETIRSEALGSDHNPMLIKFFIDDFNSHMLYGAIPPGTLNMVLAPPGRGKTTLLINQGLSCAKQGFHNLHVFLGDMSLYDGRCRYLSCRSGVPTSSIVKLGTEKYAELIRKFNMDGSLSRCHNMSYAPGEKTASQLIEDIYAMQRDGNIHFNQVIIDYDENITPEDDSSYVSGGDIYNKMALFAKDNKSVVFIASQPKPEFWKCEIIPLSAAAESSKKQKIIDLMFTLGKPGVNSTVGTLYVPKNRRGDDNLRMRLSIDGRTAIMSHISEEEYETIKSRERSSDND